MNYREPSPPKTKPPSGYIGVARNVVETPKGTAYRVSVSRGFCGGPVADWRYSSGDKLGFWASFRCGLAQGSWDERERKRKVLRRKQEEAALAAHLIAGMADDI